MKVREELETVVGDGETCIRCFEQLGYHVWFRYQKYREEYARNDVSIAIDETPVGVFVEIEGGEQGIGDMAQALGRRPDGLPARFVSRPLHGAPAGPRPAGHRHGLRRRRERLTPARNAVRQRSTRADSRMLPPALVLTAGLGTRLRPLSSLRAKPALPVAGTPLIARILTWLAAKGVRDVILNLHHLPATITAIVGDGTGFGLSVRYSWEQPLLGSGGGPRRAFSLVDGDALLVVNGDTLTDVDVRALWDWHRQSRCRRHDGGGPQPASQRSTAACWRSPTATVTGFTRPGATRPAGTSSACRRRRARAFDARRRRDAVRERQRPLPGAHAGPARHRPRVDDARRVR